MRTKGSGPSPDVATRKNVFSPIWVEVNTSICQMSEPLSDFLRQVCHSDEHIQPALATPKAKSPNCGMLADLLELRENVVSEEAIGESGVYERILECSQLKAEGKYLHESIPSSLSAKFDANILFRNR